jgi:hypothetical protein
LNKSPWEGKRQIQRIRERYCNEGFFSFEAYGELFLVDGDGEVSSSCPWRHGDEDINIFERLIPFVR